MLCHLQFSRSREADAGMDMNIFFIPAMENGVLYAGCSATQQIPPVVGLRLQCRPRLSAYFGSLQDTLVVIHPLFLIEDFSHFYQVFVAEA